MSENLNAFGSLAQRSLFLVWGVPSLGPRSRVMARELGIEELHYLSRTSRRGLLTAPLKYAYQALQTLRLLFRKRPQIVFVQSPPSLAVLFVYIYCALTNSRYLVDAHSAALLLPYWTRPRWLHAFLARRAVCTIVTNEYFQELIQAWGASAFILRDIPTTFPAAGSYPMNGDFNVVMVNTFSPDEPWLEVLLAAEGLENVQIYITGKVKNADAKVFEQLPQNVHFTGFLPDEKYYALLRRSDAVMCLTTRDHTMQRGACEALSLGKPIITSDWPLLREYFNQGTVHVENSPAGIRQGVLEMRGNYDRYSREIKELQAAQQREWEGKAATLAEMVEASLAA